MSDVVVQGGDAVVGPPEPSFDGLNGPSDATGTEPPNDEHLRRKVERVAALLGDVEPAFDRDGRFLGAVGGPEHRTVGSRAWCFQVGEWCYPTAFCRACDPIDAYDVRNALNGDDDA